MPMQWSKAQNDAIRKRIAKNLAKTTDQANEEMREENRSKTPETALRQADAMHESQRDWDKSAGRTRTAMGDSRILPIPSTALPSDIEILNKYNSQQ